MKLKTSDKGTFQRKLSIINRCKFAKQIKLMIENIT